MNMNPMQLLSMMMNGKMPDNFTSNIMNEVASKIIGTLYKEVDADEDMKKILFVKDPRQSEKIKALQTLVQEGIAKVLPKMKQDDVTMLYNVLQKCKED
jgi:hypothetical protein